MEVCCQRGLIQCERGQDDACPRSRVSQISQGIYSQGGAFHQLEKGLLDSLAYDQKVS
jgi:hypothetical protein